MTTTDAGTPAEPETVAGQRKTLPERVVSAVERVGLTIAAGALLTMTVLMVVETAMRYFVGSPLGWSFGFIQDYLLPGYFFLALAYTVRSGAHVTIDVVYQRCPAGVRTAMTVIARVLMLGFSALLLWAGLLTTHEAWSAHDIPPPGGSEFSIPTWTWHVLVPIGAVLLTARLLVDLVTRREPDRTDETGEIA
ncbi:TRAP transporter small permease [Prauserella cavernicola]|uniref:TRAP transporter small permease n=1 Tax=Prauserella cavernicola TaxID=2800127 RepID=A0A934QQM9_9PSEU|nr:TRAP transporter small permease [Prauserella cavernicola]MBK1783934.1 TRAP transporter small permease [Prauserella cavernicola]